MRRLSLTAYCTQFLKVFMKWQSHQELRQNSNLLSSTNNVHPDLALWSNAYVKTCLPEFPWNLPSKMSKASPDTHYFCWLLFMYNIGNLLQWDAWTEQRQNVQVQQDFIVMFCLVFCVFTCVAPTFFKILGTALRGQSCPLDMLDCCPSLLVFKVAVSHSSSAVRVCFTSRERQTFPLVQKTYNHGLLFKAGLAVQVWTTVFWELQRIKWRYLI